MPRRDSLLANLKYSKKGTVSLDLSLFQVGRLKTQDGVDAAFAALDDVLYRCDIDTLLASILLQPHLLEFIISASAQTTSSFLCQTIIDRFPSTPENFSSSFSSTLLPRLSLYLLFLAYPSREETPENLKELRQSVELGAQVLEAIVSLNFGVNGGDVDTPTKGVDVDDVAKALGAKVKQTQRKAKQARKSSRAAAPIAQSGPFFNAGVDVPGTADDAQQLGTKILDQQRTILQYYLDILRRPTLSDIIKARCIPEGTDTIKQTHLRDDPEEPSSTAVDERVDQTPNAYPIVQPMRAALYFDSAEGFGDWRIFISTRADKSLREARKHGKSFDIILKKIKELSNGLFSVDNQKRLNGRDTDVPIFEAKMTRDLRLVYQVDCRPEFGSTIEKQVLNIFGIYTHAQLDKRLWDSVGSQLAKRGREYRHRCIFRNNPIQGNIMPASFPSQVETVSSVPGQIEPIKEDLEELHSLLVLEKFVVFSQALLNSIIADQDVTHVFAVSPQEQCVIEHASSCYVLGRSGTGKTTTMLFKMLAIENFSSQTGNCYQKPRQLFITKSRILAERVEAYFLKLMDSFATASKSPDREERANVFEKRKVQERVALIAEEDHIQWRCDLPARFSLLRDEHFPLFLTFDRLCELIESDLQHFIKRLPLTDDYLVTNCRSSLTSGNIGTDDLSSINPSSTLKTHRRRCISIEDFVDFYWPHLPQSLTKGLDPALVFNEFLGVIKGSEGTVACKGGYLDRQTYDTFSHRSQATFSGQRAVIYSLFESYMKHKQVRGEYDAADRTHAILHELALHGAPGQMIDFLYVDEVQDNLLIDALLLRRLCTNPRGLFWAGDTAQSISVGSSFRFNELKACLYRVEEREMLVEAAHRTAVHPTMFQLTVNYRSHGGIVDCASSVVELITHFWPNSIDILEKERGIINGLKPLFFSEWDQGAARSEQFLSDNTRGNNIELGARQCTLVRSESVIKQLRNQVGDIGIVLTVHDSKGLEFDDVVLYNFFADSPLELSQWRVVLNLMQMQDSEKVSAPAFDTVRHAGVCNELKCLYVAITRARRKLWIFDNSNKCEPIRSFWMQRNLVEICAADMDVRHLAVSSSAEEWAKSGMSLFKKGIYSQAMDCFDRASLHTEKAIAHAYYLRHQARSTPLSSDRKRVRAEAHLAAARAFVTCAPGSSAPLDYLRIAAECFVESGDIVAGARAYYDAMKYTDAARLFRQAGMFDDAVKFVKCHGEEVEADVAERIIDVAKLFYLKKQKLQESRDLFESQEEELAFAKDYDLDVAPLLENMGRVQDAAESHLAEGRVVDAIRIFLADRTHESSMRQAGQYVLAGLWRAMPFGTPRGTDPNEKELLDLAAKVNVELLTAKEQDEIAMFQAIASNDTLQLRRLGRKFYDDPNDMPAALIALDYCFLDPPRIEQASSQDVTVVLDAFLAHVQIMQKIASDPDPCSDNNTRRVFGLQPSINEQSVLVLRGTVLHSGCSKLRTNDQSNNETGLLVLKRDLTPVLKDFLIDRIRLRVMHVNDMCLKRTRAFLLPCLHFLLHGRCNRDTCPREHLVPSAADSQWFNNRTRLIFQQILTLQLLHSAVAYSKSDQRDRERIWLNRLYEAFNPPLLGLGTTFASLTAIPEFQRGIQVVKEWIRDFFYSSHPTNHPDSRFLSEFLKIASLSFALDRGSARGYIISSPSVTTGNPPVHLLRPNSGGYIVHQLLDALEASQPNFLPSGFRFVQHVLENKLVIDIGALCQVVDYLCGYAALRDRSRRSNSLHDVLLPKSLLQNLLQTIETAPVRNIDLRWLFVGSITSLLEQLYTGKDAEYLLYEGRELSKISFYLRNMFIIRLCSTLCLLGFNTLFQKEDLREKILKTVTSLKADGRTVSPQIGRFVYAESWSELASLVRRSMSRFMLGWRPLDEMIHIQMSFKRETGFISGARRINCNTLQDLRTLLSSDPPSISTSGVTSDPESSASSHFEILSESQEMLSGSASRLNPDRQELDNDIDGYDALSDDDEGTESEHLEDEDVPLPQENKSWMAESSSSPPSDVLIHAVRIIQRLYRRLLRRRQESGLRATRWHIAELCLEHSTKCPPGYYRMLFRGPLPHILLCLDQVHAQADSNQQGTRRRWRDDIEHDQLEDMRDEMNKASNLLKRCEELRNQLQPTSEFHLKRNVESLKSLVQEVEDLMREVPGVNLRALREDLTLGLKGMVQEPQRSKPKPQKPKLNVDDVTVCY